MKPTRNIVSYALLTLLFVLIINLSQAQSLSTNWKQELSVSLDEYVKCGDSQECKTILAESLNKVFNIKDFYSSQLGRYMVASEMSEFLKGSSQWKLIGHAYEQTALKEAQEFANSRKAILAVYLDESGMGNVAVILPGELNPSGSWGFSVPNSAAFNPNDPQKSYIDKGLSYAFTKSHLKDVLLYSRN